MASNSPAIVTGVTEDGKLVVKGIFKQQDTYGLPLLLIWKALADRDMVIAWDHYCMDALAHGRSRTKILSDVRELSLVAYGDRQVFLDRFTRFLDALIARGQKHED